MGQVAVTYELARWMCECADPPTPRARRAATHAILDWVGVTLAGSSEPLVKMLVEDASLQSNTGSRQIVGLRQPFDPATAARINGATSHALDFDDVNKRMRGHPTVVILPALLAAGEGKAGCDVVDALIKGTEVACSLGEMLGESHYLRGNHTTATVGTLAAAAGVAILWRLDQVQTVNALSLAATQAAGLRAMFGTMGKPLHAGLAAERGLLSARWAKAGIEAAADGIENNFGFGPVHSDSFSPKPIRPNKTAAFGIEENIFKYHAACYYTHSAIDAATSILRDEKLNPIDIEKVTIGLQPALHSVCDITKPETGLEVKFSIRHLVAMALLGQDTANPSDYTNALAHDENVCRLRDKIDVVDFRTDNRMLSWVSISCTNETTFNMTLDVSNPAEDLNSQETNLVQKFRRLAKPLLKQPADNLVAGLLAVDAETPIDELLNELNRRQS